MKRLTIEITGESLAACLNALPNTTSMRDTLEKCLTDKGEARGAMWSATPPEVSFVDLSRDPVVTVGKPCQYRATVEDVHAK